MLVFDFAAAVAVASSLLERAGLFFVPALT